MTQVHDRVVAAAMAELQLLDVGAGGLARSSGAPGRCRRRGTLPSSFSTWEYVPSTASGSPGPLLKEHAVGAPCASTSSAGVSHGTHRHDRSPRAPGRARMERFTPQS